MSHPGESTFRGSSLVWIVMTVLLGMIMYVYHTVSDEEVSPMRVIAATSPAALGHGAFFDVLKELGYHVDFGAVPAEDPALLVVLEPTAEISLGDFASIPSETKVLVVLPKRRGRQTADGKRTEFAEDIPREEVKSIVARFDDSAEVERPELERPERERTELEGAEPERPTNERDAKLQEWSKPKWPKPSIPELQLVRSDNLEPLMASNGLTLLGRLRRDTSPEVYVLADADLFATHAFEKNIELAVHLMDSLVPASRRIIVHERNRGTLTEKSLEVAFFEQPLVAVTIQLMALLLVVAWSAVRSFGGKRTMTPALRKGHATLLDNSAALLSDSRRCADLVRRYARTVLLDTSRRLNVPKELSEEDTIARLDGVGVTRGLESTYKDMQREANSSSNGPNVVRSINLARRLHRWREGIIRADRTSNPNH